MVAFQPNAQSWRQISATSSQTPYVSWSGTLRIGRSNLIPWKLMSLWFTILAVNPLGCITLPFVELLELRTKNKITTNERFQGGWGSPNKQLSKQSYVHRSQLHPTQPNTFTSRIVNSEGQGKYCANSDIIKVKCHMFDNYQKKKLSL